MVRRAIPPLPALRALVATATLTALAGCTVGPDWHRPDVPASRGYLSRSDSAAVATSDVAGATGGVQRFVAGAPLPADWYRLFQSPALDALVRQALAANPTREAAAARVTAAREAVTEVAGGQLPSVSLEANASRNRASGVSFGIQDPAFVNTFNLYQAQLSASYDLDLFGGLRRQIENKQALAVAAVARARDVDATLVDNVVSSALAEAGARTTLQAVQAIITRQQKTVALIEQQVKYGSALRSDVLRAQAQLDDSEARVPDIEQQIAVARHRLAVLTGQAPADYRGPALTLDDFTLPATLPVSLPSTLVRQRPDILEAEAMMHAAQAEVGVATAAQLPQIRLTADYGRIGLHPEDLVNPPAEIFGFGAGLMAPLFDGGTLRAAKRKAVAQYQVAAADYRTAVLRAFGDVADSLRALQHDAERLAARQRGRDDARQALELAEARQREGAADATDVYLAEIEYQRASIAYARARLSRLADSATLVRALGGGWTPDTTRAHDGDAHTS